MRPAAEAFLAIDEGTATTAVAAVGRAGGRWRLLAATAVPAETETDAAVELLEVILRATDAPLVSDLGLGAGRLAELPRHTSRTGPTPTLAVVGVTERSLGPLGSVAERAGWRTWRASLERLDPLDLVRLLLDGRIEAVLAGAGDPAGADERSGLGDLAAVVATTIDRRPEVPIVLAGAVAAEAERLGLGGPSEVAPADPPDSVAAADPGAAASAPAGPTILFAPAATAGSPPGDALRRLLGGLAAGSGAGRANLVRAVASLAAVLEARVELVEVGHDGGLRATASPGPRPGDEADVAATLVPAAALVPGEVSEALVDGVLAWLTSSTERSRLRDRLATLRREPWADLPGEGARLRLAAAEAALVRLDAATRELGAGPAPDLLVLAGGVWAAVPGPTVALATANTLRRPGAWQIAYDHARLLGPLGALPTEAERRAVLADLADDLLLPIGSVVMPAGLRADRTAGRLLVHGPAGATELELVPGGLELVDLAPGEQGPVELRFERPVVLGTRGRRFALDLAGGLGGLLIDLRDVPLRLPDRASRRRELLAAWQAALWPGLDDEPVGRGSA